MRTYNESFIVAAADNDADLRNRNFNYNNNVGAKSNNNNNGCYSSSHQYQYQSQSQSQNSSGGGGGAIPYHARENSLPFSYGQIGKTSTPLKSVSNSAGGGAGGAYGNNIFNDNSYLSGGSGGGDANGFGNGVYASRNHHGSDNYRKIANDSHADAGILKTQPRLKSPLLVRKTLNSHSPTRGGTNGMNGNTTNTISNTYHYTLNNNNNNTSNGYGGTGRVSPSVNGNGGLGYGNYYGTTTSARTRTPTRNDFEDLLRERREKVFNEYRDTNVVPPPQQFRSGGGGEDTTDHSTPQNRGKYNYDFEFHLNLDDDDSGWLRSPLVGSGGGRSSRSSCRVPPQPPVRRTSSNAMDHYPGTNSSNTFSKREQVQREQYRTHDIEIPALAPRDFERNYHTLSSTADALYNNNNNNNNSYNKGQSQWSNGGTGTSANSYGRDHFFETYEQRRQQTQSMPQPQRQHQPQSIQQQQRAEYTTTTTYGNGNLASYGYNNNNYRNHNNSNSSSNNVTETAVYRSRLDATPKAVRPISPAPAPIYATTAKQVVKSASYRNEATPVPAQTTTTSFTDYHHSSSLGRDMASSTSTSTLVGTPTTPLLSRPETPAFPVTPRTPFGTLQNGYSGYNSSPTGRQRLDHSLTQTNGNHQYSSEAIYQLTSPRSRLNSNLSTGGTEPQEVAAHLVKFAKDSSKFWYKPNLSRDEAISLLLNAPPGTFLVRDSTTYKNAYGLVLRVAQPPPNSNSTGKPDELVRHFLIEPTTRGVRLKGCPNEPVFTSLSALIYEHSINQLALPCLLRIPEEDVVPPLIEPTAAQRQLLSQGAACNVLWLYSCDTESLTGEEAIRKALRQLYAQPKPLPQPTEVHFKVSQQGITLTDNTRKKFFRKHYAADMISFCAIDPDHRMWTMEESTTTSQTPTIGALKKTIFAFVARKSPSSKDNQCHVFCDLAVNQPASAIVSFANKTLPTDRQRNYVL